MSWLLVAFIPALLMLATVGLGRLEIWLGHDALSATDVAEFFEQAQAQDVRTLAREGMPNALDHLHRRRSQAITDAPVPASHISDAHPLLSVALSDPSIPILPTRNDNHPQASQPLKATQHVDRV